MRARQPLSAALALAGFLALSGCANDGGLRVEGADAPATSTTPSGEARGFVPEQVPTIKPTPIDLNLQAVRKALLADKQLDSQSRAVLSKCTLIERCLSRGATVDAMHSGQPQLIVLIHTVEKFVFGGFLIAVGPGGPRRVWSLKAQQLKINPGANGDLVAESELFTLTDQPCCPSGKRVEVYRWDGRQMAKVSSLDQEGD
ncbi:hypothetical protein GCM10009789_80640 [Kribbella sancticallisti]|uniref:Lipoprotein n=1 Tax=Kribbella sancticallisti TaxID=460087 RepID=A0ABP4QKE0_9ACTN